MGVLLNQHMLCNFFYCCLVFEAEEETSMSGSPKLNLKKKCSKPFLGKSVLKKMVYKTQNIFRKLHKRITFFDLILFMGKRFDNPKYGCARIAKAQ